MKSLTPRTQASIMMAVAVICIAGWFVDFLVLGKGTDRIAHVWSFVMGWFGTKLLAGAYESFRRA